MCPTTELKVPRQPFENWSANQLRFFWEGLIAIRFWTCFIMHPSSGSGPHPSTVSLWQPWAGPRAVSQMSLFKDRDRTQNHTTQKFNTWCMVILIHSHQNMFPKLWLLTQNFCWYCSIYFRKVFKKIHPWLTQNHRWYWSIPFRRCFMLFILGCSIQDFEG